VGKFAHAEPHRGDPADDQALMLGRFPVA
jgi:hypothetical protein